MKHAEPYRLLVADDDDGFRSILREIFEPYVRFIEAHSGEQAIEIVEAEKIDIILLDMHMDVLTGLETLLIVKSKQTLLPCILVTADATDELRHDALEADAYSVLSKPVGKSELVTTVSTALAETYSDARELGRFLYN